MAETTAPGILSGKRGLIMGVANNRSIAWGIAQAARRQGAELAFTYQGEALKKRVEPLAAELDAAVVGHCDVTEPATIHAVFAEAAAAFGSMDELRSRFGPPTYQVHFSLPAGRAPDPALSAVVDGAGYRAEAASIEEMNAITATAR